jgi:hypothetical protein
MHLLSNIEYLFNCVQKEEKMFNTSIDKTDKVNRILVGAILIGSAFLGLDKSVMFILGAIQLLEGITGICLLSTLMRKFSSKLSDKAEKIVK